MDTVSGFSPGIAARDEARGRFLGKKPRLLGGAKQTHEFEAARKASFIFT
jgi:hypothetical protein